MKLVMAGAAKKEFGVFLPIANGGWIISKTTPKLDGLWKQNLDAALLADRVGLDFVMSMGKWRGFGGETNHWGVSLESATMMAAIAQATSRVKVWATMHTLLHNPAVAAKMIATIDHISGGRAGLNIVAGAYRAEFDQMGAWDDTLSHDERYALTEEWTMVVKRLWSEPSVNHHGRFFQMRDCVSDPKPLSRPRPQLICAGVSDRGLNFAAREADACFIGGRSLEEHRDASRRARAAAGEVGRNIKTYAMCTLVAADTDAKAEALAQRYRDGVDMGAVLEMLRSWGLQEDRLDAVARQQGAFMTQTAIGSYDTCADRLERFLTEAELDGVMMIFPDYVEGLTAFGEAILPALHKAAA